MVAALIYRYTSPYLPLFYRCRVVRGRTNQRRGGVVGGEEVFPHLQIIAEIDMKLLEEISYVTQSA